MTACNSGASQASQFWTRPSTYTIQSGNDYLIRVLKVYGQWSYLAFGPEAGIRRVPRGELENFQGIEYKEHYAIGDTVPPSFSINTRKARQHIGTFNERDYPTVDNARAAAKAACDQHLNDSRVLPEPKPCGPGTPRNLASYCPNTLPNNPQSVGA